MMMSESAIKVKGRWTPEQDKLLGTVPDADIARRLGCNEVTVRSRRVRLGISATCHVVSRSPCGAIISGPAGRGRLRGHRERFKVWDGELNQPARLGGGFFIAYHSQKLCQRHRGSGIVLGLHILERVLKIRFPRQLRHG